MRAAPVARFAHRLTWAVFISLLLFALLFVTHTVAKMPPMVASHFDGEGRANAFMTRGGYGHFVLAVAVGMPLAVVGILTAVYSRATNMNLPNRDYWLAPQRLARTRAFLVAHGVWFGSLLVMLGCFIHWLELVANHAQPPHLPNQAMLGGIILFLLATAIWLGAIIVALRRPGVE